MQIPNLEKRLERLDANIDPEINPETIMQMPPESQQALLVHSIFRMAETLDALADIHEEGLATLKQGVEDIENIKNILNKNAP